MLRVRVFHILIAALCVSGSARATRPVPVQFTRLQSAVSGERSSVTVRESQRIERFLSAVFPMRTMRHLERATDQPYIRHATYTMIEQDGIRYVLAGFTARWTNAVNVFAMYRIEDGAPNQVWRSRPWEANYGQLSFKTARIGRRSVVLFQECGAPDEFSLASVFTFANKTEGLVINDLTPSVPWLRARTHFPFRPLYGTSITLQQTDSHLTLSASDQEYHVGLATAIRPERSWQYIPRRDRFERLPQAVRSASELTKAVR